MKDEIKSLTSFRFIAAFIVFLLHCKIHLGFSVENLYIDQFIANGAVFMTAFFVLSGYVLSFAYRECDFTKKNSLKHYYLRRFSRIYPVYFFASVFYFIFFHNTLGYDIGDWVRIIINDLFLFQAFFSNMFRLGLNSGTWSLSIEAFFYLLFPLFLLVFRNKPYILFVVAFVYTAIINVNVILENYSVFENIKTHYSNPIMRLNEFMIGIAFYFLKESRLDAWFPRILKSPIFISFLIVLASVCPLSSLEFSFMGFHFCLVPLFGLFIYNLHVNGLIIIENRIMVYLGKISYSFYIWQFFALEVGKYCLNDIGLSMNYTVLLVLSVNILLSSLSYHIIEVNFRKYCITILSRYVPDL